MPKKNYHLLEVPVLFSVVNVIRRNEKSSNIELPRFRLAWINIRCVQDPQGEAAG